MFMTRLPDLQYLSGKWNREKMLGANPRHRHHAAPSISENEQEMTSVFMEDTRRSLVSRSNRSEETNHPSSLLRSIKWIALIFIALCICAGAVLSKVSLISITGRMFNLTLYDRLGGHEDKDRRLSRSKLFAQLTLALVLPEVISFVTCLVKGVVGKTDNTYPWPKPRWALVWALATSFVEVVTLCGFVFGVACKLPPALTLLILNGCFCFPIGCYLVHKLKNRKRQQPSQVGYERISGHDELPTATEQNMGNTNRLQVAKRYLKYLLTVLELLGLLMQLGALVSIPILLSNKFSPLGRLKDHIVATYILLPVSLCVISFVWSGWIQSKTMESSDNTVTARFKTGLIGSAFRIIFIPFVSYGYAVLLLDLKLDLSSKTFDWDDLELGIFLLLVIASLLTYLFAWIACVIKSWAFLLPMLASTPISFVWYVGSVEHHKPGVFPFFDEYFVGWNLHYSVFIVASLLWASQFLAFGYHIFQNSDNVLTMDADLFWMPRYNSIFLEQQLILNRKTAISGNVIDSKLNRYVSMNNIIFMCSTMYHETEVEMKQLLTSINRIAEAKILIDRKHTFESHIFFDSACSGVHLNKWAVQLLGLLSTIGIKDVNKLKKMITPYGMQFTYDLGQNKMPFYIHFKDSSKVKNKKRWSQVMYMKYILEHRIKEQCDQKKAFILTTDADVDFTSDSVLALLDILACDERIAAVCARTHPRGNGPMVWYQVFDYAIGHWFQKAAEHILGCVLCCPGCFSVFRVSDLNKVLEDYSGNVENGIDFLTKDMGEDRWLCTLLIQKGCRLEYSAVSQDSTYCPDTFEEFYKQRRRWIPSTIANLALVVNSWYKITSNNDSITILFILYEFLIIFSSLISPATVILIMVTGIKAIDENIHEIALIAVLGIISVLFGVICIYAKEKTQLNVAKFLTLIFSIVMAVVISGILSDTISGVIKGEEMRDTNHTSHHFQLPVDISAIYFGIFAVTFVIAGILHFTEFFSLFHSIWYLLCLPSGYLLLIIYSVCNINNQSWGTREHDSSSNSGSWLDYLLGKWHKFLDFLNKCFRRKQTPHTKGSSLPRKSDTGITNVLIPYSELDDNVKEWLRQHKCDKMYAESFEAEGYTKLDFIATMKMEDFKAIGITKKGFQLKLEKEVKKLPAPQFQMKDIPENVSKWLEHLNLVEYTDLFESEGYFSSEDVENLKQLTEDDLRDMGITKRAHLKQLLTGLRYLQYPTALDIRINKTRALMEENDTLTMDEIHDSSYKEENTFWTNLIKDTLKPQSANFSKVDELKEKLTDLRNLSVLILFLINVMWIVFLYTLVFPQLTKYNLPEKAFSLLFLFIFSIILLIQFFAMLFHRFKTLLHLLAGIRPADSNAGSQWNNGQFDDVRGRFEETMNVNF